MSLNNDQLKKKKTKKIHGMKYQPAHCSIYSLGHGREGDKKGSGFHVENGTGLDIGEK